MAPDSNSQTEPQGYNQSFSAPPSQPPIAQPHFHPQHQQNVKAQQAGYAQYPASYGQPFQPYDAAYGTQSYKQQQQQQHQMYQPTPLTDTRAWGITHLVLHSLGVVLCIIGIGVSVPTAGYYSEYAIAAYISAPIFGAALLWSGAELITRIVRLSKHKIHTGIHPGAHVALSLLIWLAAGILGGIEAALAALNGAYYDYNCDNSYSYGNSSYDDCDSDSGSKMSSLFSAAAALTCILAVLHFALFVIACIDTSKRNSQARRPIMVVNGWGPPAQGWQPMQNAAVPETYKPEQHQQQYQQQQPQQRDVSVPSEQGQNIPLQTRSPSPMMTPATHEAPVGESSRHPEEGHNMTEYYTPRPGVAV